MTIKFEWSMTSSNNGLKETEYFSDSFETLNPRDRAELLKKFGPENFNRLIDFFSEHKAGSFSYRGVRYYACLLH